MNEYKGRMVLRGDKPSGKGCKGKRKEKSKGKGKRGYPRHHRNPSGFAYHATEEDFACGYTAAEDDSEPYANPAYVDDEDYSGDDAEAYNAYDEDYDDYDEVYDAYADAQWIDHDSVVAYYAGELNNRWSVDDPIEAAELDGVAYVAQQSCYLGASPNDFMNDPESCADIIQECTAFVAKGKGNEKEKAVTLSVLLIYQ